MSRQYTRRRAPESTKRWQRTHRVLDSVYDRTDSTLCHLDRGWEALCDALANHWAREARTAMLLLVLHIFQPILLLSEHTDHTLLRLERLADGILIILRLVVPIRLLRVDEIVQVLERGHRALWRAVVLEIIAH